MVLALHKRNFIVDRELYLDMAFSSIMRKPGGGGREEPCCIPSIYRAIKLVVSHKKQQFTGKNKIKSAKFLLVKVGED